MMLNTFDAFLSSCIQSHDNRTEECNIWTFNFGTEKFLRIPTPDEFDVRPCAALTVSDCYLCFSAFLGMVPRTETKLWVMKEYGLGHSWVKHFIIHVSEPLMNSP